MNQYKTMSDEYLRKTYVPDVYQKSIFSIDYTQLKNAGIKLISFDIDGTIAPITQHSPEIAVVTLFEKLKFMGFEIFLLSNANDNRVKRFAKKLKVDGVARAEKPYISGFEAIQNMYKEKCDIEIAPEQIAHVGNHIIKDVGFGNTFGVTTCLVRNIGKIVHPKSMLNPKKSERQKLREVLLKRGIWRKHHLNAPDDQYYQLEETQFNSK